MFTVKLKAGVIVRHRGQVLLIRERNNRTRRYAWNVIKGTFEPGKDASIIETAIREAREEANAKIKPRYLLRTYYLLDRNDALMMFVLVADLIDSRIGVAPREVQAQYGTRGNIIETRFFTRKELLKLKPSDFVGMRGYLAVRDYLSGKRFPLNILHTLPPK